jgi:hypothetical protein
MENSFIASAISDHAALRLAARVVEAQQADATAAMMHNVKGRLEKGPKHQHHLHGAHPPSRPPPRSRPKWNFELERESVLMWLILFLSVQWSVTGSAFWVVMFHIDSTCSNLADMTDSVFATRLVTS